jgi:hypothetical protein
MSDLEIHGQPAAAPKANLGKPILITCLAIAIAALLFAGGLGIGFAAGKWGAAPVANGAPGTRRAAAALRAQFPSSGKRWISSIATSTASCLNPTTPPTRRSAGY